MTTDRYGDVVTNPPPMADWTRRLEQSPALDRLARLVQPVADALVADPARRDALRGMWLGHAVHPMLTDLPIGFWTSASMLDLVGGCDSRTAARRLVALGILAAVPTAVTGVAEWAGTETRERRVGVVHAASNTAALLMYAASYRARRGGRHVRGAMLAGAGGLAATVGGYLGGHLVEVRKVSSRHPTFGP